MSNKKQVIVNETFSRDQLVGKRNSDANEFLASTIIFGKLRAKGVPVIGVLGVIAVEWGTLTIAHEDGLDGDEWHFTWTGEPMPDEWIAKCAKPGAALRLNNPLAKQIADADEL